MINAVCPNPACGRSLRMEERFVGKKVACIHCKQPFQVDVMQPPAGETGVASGTVGPDATTTPGLPTRDVFGEETIAGPAPGMSATDAFSTFPPPAVRPALTTAAAGSGPPPLPPRPRAAGSGLRVGALVVSLLSVAITAGSLAGIVHILRPPAAANPADAAAQPAQRWAAVTIESRGVRLIIADVTPTLDSPDQPYQLTPVETDDREWSLGKLTFPLADKRPESMAELETVLKKLNEQLEANKVPVENRLLACNGGVLSDAKDPADVKKLQGWMTAAARAGMNRDLDIISEAQEAEYGARGSILHKFRRRSVCLDLGNSSTKYGYFYGDFNDIPSFRGLKFKYGVKAGVEGIGERAKSMRLPFARAAAPWGKAVVEPDVVALAKDHAQLVNCQRFYLLGGTAWAVSVLTHPEAFEPAPDARPSDVLLGTKPTEADDIDRFLKLVGGKKTYAEVKAEVVATRPAGASHLDDELTKVGRAFTLDKLVAGGTVLKSFADGCQFNNKEVRFFTRSLHAWPLGYILVKGNFDR